MKSLSLTTLPIQLLAHALLLVVCLPVHAQFGGGGGSVEKQAAEKIQLHELRASVQKLLAEQQHLSKAQQLLLKEKAQLERELKNASLQVFQLKHIPARDAANHLDFVLGQKLARISHDEKRNLLLLAAKAEIANRVGDILQTLDIPVPSTEEGTSTKDSLLPDSLMVRILWLSDGPVYDEAQPANTYIPSSVHTALQKVGIDNPHIVLQSNATVAFDETEDGRAATLEIDDMPAVVFGERLPFHAAGKIRATNKGQLYIEMQIHTYRQDKNGKDFYDESRIRGSMIAPLNHYLVLGTSNYASVYPDNKYDTARFAYVLQIVEANTYAPEE